MSRMSPIVVKTPHLSQMPMVQFIHRIPGGVLGPIKF